jgi:hypothetical protein
LSDKSYKIIEGADRAKLEDKINELADQNYKVVAAFPVSGSISRFVLEKQTQLQHSVKVHHEKAKAE